MAISLNMVFDDEMQCGMKCKWNNIVCGLAYSFLGCLVVEFV